MKGKISIRLEKVLRDDKAARELNSYLTRGSDGVVTTVRGEKFKVLTDVHAPGSPRKLAKAS